MKFVSTKTMRALDESTINEEGILGSVLMDRASRGVARVVQQRCEAMGKPVASLLLVAGKGNNGGDAFLAAYYLHRLGHRVVVCLAGLVSEVQGDAAWALNIMRGAKVPLYEWPIETEWNAESLDILSIDVVVDGLLGTGSQGKPRGVMGRAVQFIRDLKVPVVAIDIPSGWDADSGASSGLAIEADATVTIGLPKSGFLTSGAETFFGSVSLVDIGIPEARIKAAEGSSVEMIHEGWVRDQLPRRGRAFHKGDVGRVLIIGGSRGLTGAVSLASRAALRSGAGLVTVLTPESLVPIVAGNVQEAMVHGGSENASGGLSSLVDDWSARWEDFDAIVCGPGIGRDPEVRTLIDLLRSDYSGPLILDADALTLFAGEADQLAESAAKLILTPHPGEMASLLGKFAMEVQSDRAGAVASAAETAGAVVVLKGAGTRVAEPSGRQRINLNGNPGMATGGTGDVLAGMVGALCAQGITPFDAASVVVWVHGQAGDFAALERSESGMIAGDLLDGVSRLLP